MAQRKEIPDFIVKLLITRIRNQHVNLNRERKYGKGIERKGMNWSRWYRDALNKFRYLHRSKDAVPKKRHTGEISDAWENFQIAKLKRLNDEMRGWAELEYAILEKMNNRNFPQELGFGWSLFLSRQKVKFKSRVEGANKSKSKDSWFRVQQKKLRGYRVKRMETEEESRTEIVFEILNNKLRSRHRDSLGLNEDALLSKYRRMHPH